MRKVKVTLAVGMVLLAGVCTLTLTRSPPRVLRVSGPPANGSLGITINDPAICQYNEALPSGVTAIRLPMIAFFGANVRVVAYQGDQTLTEGRRGANWTGVSVTVPVKALEHRYSHVRLCVVIGPNSEPIILTGHLTPSQEAARTLSSSAVAPTRARHGEVPLKGRMVIEYISSGEGSWWSRLLTVARHVGIGRAYRGTWIALLIAVLMAGLGALATGLALRELP